jgi:hypothetical protein
MIIIWRACGSCYTELSEWARTVPHPALRCSKHNRGGKGSVAS